MYDASVKQILPLLPPDIRAAVQTLPETGRLEELRLRLGFEPTVISGGKEAPLSLLRPLTVEAQTLAYIVNAASGYSAYAADVTLREGFLPLPGGHRLGLCGTAVMQNGAVTTLGALSSANLRIARSWSGSANALYAALQNAPESTLIVGPPGSGKTTLLRDLVRQLSDKSGFRVGVSDSRGELAACRDGAAQLYVGKYTDIVSLLPKDQGIELLVRVMNPEWVAVDEITAASDVEAMVRASYCGVRLLATAHAFSRDDLYRRPVYRQMLESGIFRYLAVLDREKHMQIERLELPC